MEDAELVQEFLIESNENLCRLDQEMVELERHPEDAALLASVFRTVHTIKGTCGFLNFVTLEKITHQVENVLSQVRNAERELTPELASLVLQTIDAVKLELRSIELTGQESGHSHAELLRKQETVLRQRAGSPLPTEMASLQEDLIVAETVPAEPEPARTSNDANRQGSVCDSRIRVEVALLNKLMNLVGELVLARNQILQFNNSHEDPILDATSQRLNLITTELQEAVMKTRMQPIGIVWSPLPRVVRDLANAFGKQIALRMDGAETELDKTIIEAIKDPITHIVRNACDHGIESREQRIASQKPAEGRLTLRAFHEGGNVNIEISDDGAGIDIQALKARALERQLVRPERAERMTDRELIGLAFLPGLSTAKKLSSISGRGVGMDVVKTNIEKIGGTVDLLSVSGKGTTVRFKIPLTLAIIPGLVVSSADERFVIPQLNLVELIRLEGPAAHAQIEKIHNTCVFRRRGVLLPIARLNQVLRLSAHADETSEITSIVIVRAEDRQFGLIVDRIEDTQEIVVKPLGALLKPLKCYAGATIMGDGQVSLILDVAGIAKLSGVGDENRNTDVRSDLAQLGQSALSSRQTFLLFRAGEFQRLAVPLSLVARLEEIAPDRLEHSTGGLVVQYRNQILPLIPLASRLSSGPDASPCTPSRDQPVLVVVFADGDRLIGLVVDQIIDIVEDRVSISRASGRNGLIGSSVIGGKVTDFLDLHGVLRDFDRWSLTKRPQSGPEATVLLTEPSPFSRGLLRNYLEIAGHSVLEAASSQEAMERLSTQNADVVLAARDLPDQGAEELLDWVRAQPSCATLPVVALYAEEPQEATEGHDERFSDSLYKFDRNAMLRSVSRLARMGDRANERRSRDLIHA